MPALISVRGPSGSGKTTLIERLLPRLAERGLKVGTIKHAHHGLTLDAEGKDSWRMWQAGAAAVAVASPHETFVRQRGGEPSLESLLALMPGELDCILVEGFADALDAQRVPVALRLAVTPSGVTCEGRRVSRNQLRRLEAAIVGCCGKEEEDGVSHR
ncbi:MAG: molybdopterin-guanine dinucleotide biosynthesis protein B [Candidatus Omnitrophica bacterium]|nr:molybdopterin-guanine dinucleotide biosynthesis protein B [Candidatus Omnitrophota bacterium]